MATGTSELVPAALVGMATVSDSIFDDTVMPAGAELEPDAGVPLD